MNKDKKIKNKKNLKNSFRRAFYNTGEVLKLSSWAIVFLIPINELFCMKHDFLPQANFYYSACQIPPHYTSSICFIQIDLTLRFLYYIHKIEVPYILRWNLGKMREKLSLWNQHQNIWLSIFVVKYIPFSITMSATIFKEILKRIVSHHLSVLP